MDYSFRRHRGADAHVLGDEFWEGLEDGVLRVSRCASCKRSIWEPDYRCGECGGWDLEWVEVPSQGTVYAWSRATQDLGAAARWKPPYVTVQVEVGGPGGPKLTGVLRGPEAGLRVGAEVSGSIDPPSEATLGYPALRWALV
jgi:uncharacterized OB-fold protein